MQRVNLAEKIRMKVILSEVKLNVILNGVCIWVSFGLLVQRVATSLSPHSFGFFGQRARICAANT